MYVDFSSSTRVICVRFWNRGNLELSFERTSKQIAVRSGFGTPKCSVDCSALEKSYSKREAAVLGTPFCQINYILSLSSTIGATLLLEIQLFRPALGPPRLDVPQSLRLEVRFDLFMFQRGQSVVVGLRWSVRHLLIARSSSIFRLHRELGPATFSWDVAKISTDRSVIVSLSPSWRQRCYS